MIYMGVIAFALFVGVCMIDDLFVTKEHKWVKHTQKGISKLRKWSRSRGFGQPNAVKVSKLTYRIKNPRILMRGVGQFVGGGWFRRVTVNS